MENKPILHLHDWLTEQKEQIYSELQEAKSLLERFRSMSKDDFEDGDRKAFEQSRLTIVSKQAELTLIERVQAKIQQLSGKM